MPNLIKRIDLYLEYSYGEQLHEHTFRALMHQLPVDLKIHN